MKTNIPLDLDSLLKTCSHICNDLLFPGSVATPTQGRASPRPPRPSRASRTARLQREYPHILLVEQLYACYPGQEGTVDRLVRNNCNRIVRIDMDQENFPYTVLVLADTFREMVYRTNPPLLQDIADRYVNMVLSYGETRVSRETLREHSLCNGSRGNISSMEMQLVHVGLLVLSREEGVYNLTLTHLGGLLRVVDRALRWVLRQLDGAGRGGTVAATVLREKWYGGVSLESGGLFRGASTSKEGVIYDNKVKKEVSLCIYKFRGMGLEYVLLLALGRGLLEKRKTPTGVFYMRI